MMKIAVIFESSPFDRKGLFNAVHERVRHLLAEGGCTIDAYCVHSRDNAFTRKVRHTPETPSVDHVTIDGIRYEMMWYRFSVVDHVLVEKMHRRPLLFKSLVRRVVDRLQGYDVIIGHSFTGSYIAYMAHCIYGTIFFANWHGSDVHTHPWRLPMMLDDTRKIMKNAACNFFVSKALKDFSDKIVADAPKEVLYNGVSDSFVRFPDAERAAVRKRFGVTEGDKSVSFAGSLVSVKNVRVLAPLFRKICERFDGSVKFLIAGDGKLRSSVEADMSAAGLDVSFLGNLGPEEMPAFMNSTDVLVLPSLNEGLPLVCAEALRCGANAAGSDVGGIPEVIGAENVFPLGPGFTDALADRVVQMLQGNVLQQVPSELDWSATASKEHRILWKLQAFGEG
ncbi:MAG: glycosyltransferase [Bacteroidales bacterium]|nr:glycosyltransferase [Bacteroidales bacterium]